MHSATFSSRRYVACLVALLWATASWYVKSPALASSPSVLDPTSLTETEKWVVERVKAGEIADLAQRSSQVLRTSFLKNLFTTPLDDGAEERWVVRMQNAVLTGPMYLTKKTILHEIWCIDCQFESEVNLSQSHFRERVVFRGSSFQSANFAGAEFAGPAVFEQSAFTGSVTFEGSAFQDANFTETAFAGTVTFADSVFKKADFRKATFQSDVFFTGMKVRNNALFTAATFAGTVSFDGAEITKSYWAQGTHFSNPNFRSMQVKDTVNFENGTFAGYVSFEHLMVTNAANFDATEFTGEARFDRMQVGGTVSFKKAKFTYRQPERADNAYDAVFNRLQVKDTVNMNEALFHGKVDFRDVDISRNFEAKNATFESEAIFDGLKVGGTAFFDEAKFQGPLVFRDVDISRDFKAPKTLFQSDVFFAGLKVGDTAFFNAATFAGAVSFVGAEIRQRFWAENAYFSSPQASLSFQGMQVKDADFANTTFAGPVVSFDRIQVGNIARFDQAVFTGKVSMTHAMLRDVSITGPALGARHPVPRSPVFSPDPRPQVHRDSFIHLDLSQTEIKGELKIEHVRLQHMTATLLQVQGPTYLTHLTITDSANLEFARFGLLQLCVVDLPSTPISASHTSAKPLKLHGMTYQYIRTGKGQLRDGQTCEVPMKETIAALPTKKIFPWTLQGFSPPVEYTPSVYKNLEDFFHKLGDPEAADDAYVAMKWHERTEVATNLKLVWNFFLHIFVGDGRRPGLAFLWSALIILIGCGVFYKREGMVLKDPTESFHRYNPMWYSLDLFLPFIDLQAAQVWLPSKERWGALFYMRIHIILGWILVPIGLAVFTGIIN